MAKNCLGFDCQTMITDDHPTGFCTTCEHILKDRMEKLETDVGHLLRLEAEFVRYCKEKGHPHPHS